MSSTNEIKFMRPWECSPKKSQQYDEPKPLHQRTLSTTVSNAHSFMSKQLYQLGDSHPDIKTICDNYLYYVTTIENNRSLELLQNNIYHQTSEINMKFDRQRIYLINSTQHQIRQTYTDTSEYPSMTDILQSGATPTHAKEVFYKSIIKLQQPQSIDNVTKQRNNTPKRSVPYDIGTRKRPARSLSPDAVSLLETWYYNNIQHPYPDETQVLNLSGEAKISIVQVRKWMANKRVRSYNTLAFNGSVHPKRLQRLQREQKMLNKYRC